MVSEKMSMHSIQITKCKYAKHFNMSFPKRSCLSLVDSTTCVHCTDNRCTCLPVSAKNGIDLLLRISEWTVKRRESVIKIFR